MSITLAVTARSEEALRTRALRPIRSRLEVVEDDGVAFAVRVAEPWSAPRPGVPSEPPRNPFLPYEEELFVADLSDTHVCILNKYNVVDHHVLVITREFEEQESPITELDFAALAPCLSDVGGLGFYNAGRVAGASQRHKHLQHVPFPVGAGPEPLPMGARIAESLRPGEVGTAPRLPFPHARAALDFEIAGNPAEAGRQLHAAYCALLEALALDPETTPYNLLVTGEWMLVVPRSQGRFARFPVNSLAFAGALLVWSDAQLETVREIGPLAILRSVGVETSQVAGVEPFFAGGFLFDRGRDGGGSRVLLHHRDASAAVNPNKWGFFGGSSEPGETPIDCFRRELREETGISLSEADARPLRDYPNARSGRHRHIFFVERYVPPERISLTEGQGFAWVPVDRLAELDLTETTKADLAFFLGTPVDRPEAGR